MKNPPLMAGFLLAAFADRLAFVCSTEGKVPDFDARMSAAGICVVGRSKPSR
ncbi:hypothetical protein J8I87_16705 [Paraburkholderia sp. LEh10]|uniref:hypothetical protein n=1 Tax=Paraburkholderia sp. LEh10 TaxID=2821353 RepID=UPI001AE7ED24|nr:hypothetical protein [Paraburkholderia sp. LEh10]MBP0591332.1 hypothetical protein [Paraburkholderia sp. LEh10]